MHNINVWVGKHRTGRDTYACSTCGSERPHDELNWEGNIHHGTKVECIDRKACERRRRKRDRRAGA